jgi:predicted adenine nucleotide alpha hydrolase (AANH) superfamily ATPase
MQKKQLLLHICCAPCATHAVEEMKRIYAVTGFFSNSNIAPEKEYHRRLAEAQRVAAACDIPLVEDDYDHASWLEAIRGLELEPEKGKRCAVCFHYNLSRAATYAHEHAFDLFTTTLTISPHKRSQTIFEIGRELGPFLEADFKKRNGFKKSIEKSTAMGLYRQDYCGCEFSRR